MFLRKIISTILSAYLILGALPIQAQIFNFGNNTNNFGSWPTFQTQAQRDSTVAAQKEQQKQHRKELDAKAAIFFGPEVYSGLSYFDRLYIWGKRNPQKKLSSNYSTFGKDAFIDPAWIDYKNAIKDYYNTPYRNATPYQVLQEMQSKSKNIAKLLKNNPRYKKEVRKAKVKEYAGAAIEGIVIGLLSVATVYTFGATAGAEGALIATWFGSATTATVASTATASLTRAFALIVLGEIFIALGDEITINLYEDLTDRLIKYKYIDNISHANELIANIKSAIESGDVIATPINGNAKITSGSRWVDEAAKKESIIRLYGLSVIEAELTYSKDPTKFDLAMLDIINLFSYRTKVCYDENVFTKTIIENGEKHYVCKQNSVDVGTGRLLERTPQLTKALKEINKMANPSHTTIPSHPRAWNMGNGVSVIMPHM